MSFLSTHALYNEPSDSGNEPTDEEEQDCNNELPVEGLVENTTDPSLRAT